MEMGEQANGGHELLPLFSLLAFKCFKNYPAIIFFNRDFNLESLSHCPSFRAT